MNQIKLIFKKEATHFFKRKHMIKWLCIAISMSVLYPIAKIPGLSVQFNQFMISLLAIVFVSGFMPINMGMDAVIAERIHKTMETLISLPLNITSVLIGKVLFGTLITMGAYVVMLIINSVLLNLLFGMSLVGYFGMLELLLISIVVLCNHIIVNLITCMVGLSFSNYKVFGYAITGIDLILVGILYFFLKLNSTIGYVYNMIIVVMCVMILAAIIKKHLTKNIVATHL